MRTISLPVTQDPNEFVSQGHPRLLDDIAVSPDETEAWLPHVLWNFDHLLQLQSTIFPSASVLDLTRVEQTNGTVAVAEDVFAKLVESDPIPPELPEGMTFPITTEVKLMFWIYPQAVTNLVREQYPDLTNPDAILMTRDKVELDPTNEAGARFWAKTI